MSVFITHYTLALGWMSEWLINHTVEVHRRPGTWASEAAAVEEREWEWQEGVSAMEGHTDSGASLKTKE